MNDSRRTWAKGRRFPYRGNFRKNWRPRPQKRFAGHAESSEQSAEYQVSFPPDSSEAETTPVAPVLVLDRDIALGPYQAWKAYLPCDLYDEDIATKLSIAEQYLLKVIDSKRQDMEVHHSFTIDVKHLNSDAEFSAGWPEFMQYLRDVPSKVIGYFGLAMHHILCQEMAQEASVEDIENRLSQDEAANVMSIPQVHARFIGFNSIPFKNLKTNTYCKFVAVKGTVIRVGNIKPLCTKLAFSCNQCKTVQIVLQPCGNYVAPTSCLTRSCLSRSFEPLLNSPFTEMISWQNIRIQEMADDEQSEQGRVPRTVECELVRDLVNRCIPGDIVTVSGTVKVNDRKEKAFGAVQNKTAYLLYILANSIECLRDKNPTSQEVMPGGLQLNMSDLYSVRDIHARSNLFQLVVASLCPCIYGHEIVKAGLVLSLFGGTQHHVSNENRVPVRADSHILIVGDPGLGKTQMLLACINASPRGVYVCGNTTTSSGLTVTMTKEAGGESVLDAGALVLADQGCCCIDEFDKMSNQHHALLEAMEQQTISIAKGGMSCTLPARTSVIAAANPVGGHYNKAKTVSENIKMNSALLSRFDLVFIILDKADRELDNMMSTHVMAMHTGRNIATTSASQGCSSSVQLLDENQLVRKLQCDSKEETELISSSNLRKYIAYARKYVHPKLSAEARTVLQEFYIELRKQNQSANSIPITTRQLESMTRLTEARARVELREMCSEEDAQEVVDIMKHSMVDTFSDEYGHIDFERSIHGSGMSKRSKAKVFMQHMNKIATRLGKKVFTVQEMENLAEETQIDTTAFRDFIDGLNNQGYLIKKGPKLYQLQTL